MDYAIAIGITTALVQILRVGFEPQSRYVPIISLLLGAFIAFAGGFREIMDLLILGLGASGFYDVVKQPTQTVIRSLSDNGKTTKRRRKA